jgi:hypothetical protein
MSAVPHGERRQYWTPAEMAVAVRRSDGIEVVTRIARPFVRVGRHPANDIVLSDGDQPLKKYFFQVVGAGIYCWGTDHKTPRHPAEGRPLLLQGEIGTGSTRIRATIVQPGDPTPKPAGGAVILDPLQGVEPSGTRPPCLRIIDATGRAAAEHQIRRVVTLVGQVQPCRLRLHADKVSKIHCSLYWDGASLWVVDLLSTHGTLLNGQPIVSSEVLPGDVVGVGDCLLEYVDQLPTDRAGTEAAAMTAEPPTIAADSAIGVDADQPPHQPPRPDDVEREAALVALTTRNEALRAALDAARRETDELRTELADQGEQLMKTLAAAHAEQQRAAVAMSEVEAVSVQKIAEERAKLDQLLAEHDELSVALKDSRRAREEQEHVLEATEAEVARLTATLKAQQEEAQVLRTELTNDVRRLETALRGAQDEQDQAQARLDQMQRDSQVDDDEARRLAEQVCALETEIAARLEHQEKLEADLSAAQERQRSHQRQVELEKLLVEQATRDRQEIVATLAAERETFESARAELVDQVRQLQAELEDARQEARRTTAALAASIRRRALVPGDAADDSVEESSAMDEAMPEGASRLARHLPLAREKRLRDECQRQESENRELVEALERERSARTELERQLESWRQTATVPSPMEFAAGDARNSDRPRSSQPAILWPTNRLAASGHARTDDPTHDDFGRLIDQLSHRQRQQWRRRLMWGLVIVAGGAALAAGAATVFLPLLRTLLGGDSP